MQGFVRGCVREHNTRTDDENANMSAPVKQEQLHGGCRASRKKLPGRQF